MAGLRGVLAVCGLLLQCVVSCHALAASSTAELADAIRERLERHSIMAGQFEQSLRVEALSRPVVSHGRIYLFGEGGVIWYVDAPISAHFVIDEDGNTFSGTGEATPDLAWVTRITRALITGDFLYLSDFFTVEGHVGGESWTVDLVPTSAPLDKAVAGIRALGAGFVDELIIDTIPGDRIRIAFSNMRALAELPEPVARDLGAVTD